MGCLCAVPLYIMQRIKNKQFIGTALLVLLEGIQMLSIGVLGEYIGKIYMETKRRPRYIISERINTPICDNSSNIDSTNICDKI